MCPLPAHAKRLIALLGVAKSFVVILMDSFASPTDLDKTVQGQWGALFLASPSQVEKSFNFPR
jgi:hypothetical protein